MPCAKVAAPICIGLPSSGFRSPLLRSTSGGPQPLSALRQGRSPAKVTAPEIDGVGDGGGAATSNAPTSIPPAWARGCPAASVVPDDGRNAPASTAGEPAEIEKSPAAASVNPGSAKLEWWSFPDSAAHLVKPPYARPFQLHVPFELPSTDEYRLWSKTLSTFSSYAFSTKSCCRPATITLFSMMLPLVSNCTRSSTPSVLTTVLLTMTQSSVLPRRRS